MTLPQIIYATAVAIYLFFFLLFIRFFVWKRYADKHFWRAKPKLNPETLHSLAAENGRSIPFISMIVPARNESEVIHNTIDHLSSLIYPKDRWEIIVATDQKEVFQNEAERPKTIESTRAILSGKTRMGPRINCKTKILTLGVLTRISLEEFSEVRVGVGEDAWAKISEFKINENLLREIAFEMIEGRGLLSLGKITFLIKKAYKKIPDADVRQIYPLYLGMAMPVVAAFYRLRGNGEKLVERMISHTAKASHTLTKEILKNMTDALSGRILGQIALGQEERRLDHLLQTIYDKCFPTTQEIVEAKIEEFKIRKDKPVLKHVVVPYDFDGKYSGQCTGKECPSTKGRALNWALQFVDPKAEICGFYDAESRPDPNVLMYVAYKRVKDGDKVKILQGPVFQVRNFYEMGPFCKIASLYQAIAHDWYLPSLFRRLPFVGGTNLFAERRLLDQIKGFDNMALTEDLELGTRAYLECGAWPEYLPYYSSEQTPPRMVSFFRQRLRWGVGHLQVMDKIRSSDKYTPEKKNRLLKQLLLKGQLEWSLYQGATFVPPTMMVLWFNGLVDPTIVPGFVGWILHAFSLTYMAFTIWAYHRYMPYLDDYAKPQSPLGRASIIAQLFLLPLVAFFFPVPYTTAVILKAVNRHPKHWEKTPRTKEW